jgi:transketolase
LPNIDQSRYASARNVEKGAYILSDAEGTAEIILIGTGSELQLALGAQEELKKEGVKARVVSMPSFELFDAQEQSYKDEVFPREITKRLAVEAGITLPWYKYVTSEGAVIGLDRFGESGPGEEVMKYFGFTVENVCNTARTLLKNK